MIEWFKESLIGIVLIVICWLLFVLWIGFLNLCNEDSKRGKIAGFIGKVGSGIFFAYIALCNIVGLIVGLIALIA